MQAIILAAGKGRRLGSLTRTRAKCMVEVGGRTLIERSLDALVETGVSRIVLVVGHHGDSVRALVGSNYRGTPVLYVTNPVFGTTNNIYSLFLARDLLAEQDTLLLESDLIYDKGILARLVAHEDHNVAVVDRYRPSMDGTVVTLAPDGAISSFVTKKYFDARQTHSYFKTVNIYKFSAEFLSTTYIPFLEAYVAAVGHNEYYEQVLRVVSTLDTVDLVSLQLADERWYEIDDKEDLANAETLFATPGQAASAYSTRFGGLWRFPRVVDFAYLVNPYFPPPRFLSELQESLPTLVGSYPSTRRVQNSLAGNAFGLAPEHVVVGNGVAELIAAIGALGDGQAATVSVPTFGEYRTRFTHSHEISATPDLSVDVAALVREGGDSNVVLVNPDNPSGRCLSTDTVERLAAHAEQSGRRLILDESFVDFSDPDHCESFLQEERLLRFPHLVVLKSLGKSFGVPGLRLGLAASYDTDFLQELGAALPVWNINAMAEFFLQALPKYAVDYRESTRRVRADRADLAESLGQLPGLHPVPSQANYLFCRVDDQIDVPELVDRLVAEFGVLIKDCSARTDIAGNYIRVAVRNAVDNKRLIEALSEVLPGKDASDAIRSPSRTPFDRGHVSP